MSWYRRYRFVEGETGAVELTDYSGFRGVGVGIGWIPFVGSVRMVEVQLKTRRTLWLASTFGRRNAVRRLARRMRLSLGLDPR